MKHIEPTASKNLKLLESLERKAVRFSQLVDSSGKPEVVTLWADPKKDQAFMQRTGPLPVVVNNQRSIHRELHRLWLVFLHPRLSLGWSDVLAITNKNDEEAFIPESKMLGVAFGLFNGHGSWRRLSERTKRDHSTFSSTAPKRCAPLPL